jgi:hypothetical protein
MGKLWEEIKYDANFIKGHTLQPQWYKILKVFLLAGFFAGFVILFGWRKAGIFAGIFFSLSFLVHMTYRIKTKRFTQGWLDFKFEEVNGELVPSSIGRYYYLAVLTNALIAFFLSQFL